MIYYLNGSQCTFTEMLGAYVANSTAKEEHLLGMVVDLVDRHLRRLEPTPAQCRTITVDTQGCTRCADDGEACADTGFTASRRSSGCTLTPCLKIVCQTPNCIRGGNVVSTD
jgi:hypothetical protein